MDRQYATDQYHEYQKELKVIIKSIKEQADEIKNHVDSLNESPELLDEIDMCGMYISKMSDKAQGLRDKMADFEPYVDKVRLLIMDGIE